MPRILWIRLINSLMAVALCNSRSTSFRPPENREKLLCRDKYNLTYDKIIREFENPIRNFSNAELYLCLLVTDFHSNSNNI